MRRKLSPTSDAVTKYIEQFPPATQRRLQQLRTRVRKLFPEAEEKISYGMPAYQYHGKPLVYFAAYARHIGVYALPATHEAFAEKLAPYKQGKGSVQFPLDTPLPLSLIMSMVTYRARSLEQKKK